MPRRAALVSALWGAGFAIGPSPTADCDDCSHCWGEHRLIATGSALHGGMADCPAVDCACNFPWRVTATLVGE